jgi:2-dehydro-3-deoxyphosphogluconate aldolase/(4S)-4-hydroxy-2-oxoglutarate aldolase
MKQCFKIDRWPEVQYTANMWSQELANSIATTRVVAVIIIEDAKDAVPMARALAAGGVRHIELTLRTDAALPAIAAITSAVPEMIVGAGTVLTAEQVRQAQDAGAAFAVAPAFSPPVLTEAARVGLPFAPGVATPTDIEAAWNTGCTVMKLFPAQSLGGPAYLRSVNAAYRHLGISFIPLGGVNQENMNTWLEMPEVLAIGGSWLASPALLKKQEWTTITANARNALNIASGDQS